MQNCMINTARVSVSPGASGGVPPPHSIVGRALPAPGCPTKLLLDIVRDILALRSPQTSASQLRRADFQSTVEVISL